MIETAFNKLSSYDAVDLLATFGALQIVPQNMHHTIRLEAYAHCAACRRTLSVVGAMSRTSLLAFLEDDGLTGTGIHEAEDPCDNLFTESVMFRGGGYTVLPGITNSPTYVLKNIAKAVFLAPKPFPDAVFAAEAEHLIGAALAVSDAIATAAGLTRWMATAESTGAVRVPHEDDLISLKAAVRWTEAGLFRKLRDRNIRFSSLHPIIVGADNVHLADWDMENSLLSRRPIVRSADELVVAAPGSLLLGAINAVLDLAAQRGVLNDLASRFNAAVWDSVKHALQRMDLPRPRPVPVPHDVPCLHDGIVPIDTDKIMHLLVVTDPLDNYKPWEKREPLRRNSRAREVDTRIAEVESWLAQSCRGMLNDIIHLVVLQGMTRDEFFAFPEDTRPQSQGVSLTGEGLEVISLKESGDPLAVWKFIRARERVRQRSELLCFDALDEYAFYIEKSHGYYVSDGPSPAVLQIQPGFSAALKQEVMTRRDSHAVLSYDRQHVFEVIKLFGTGDVPICFPIKDLGSRASLLVEGFSLPVWVLGPVYENDEQRAQHSSYAQLVDAIAYWLWQFTPFLCEAMSVLAERADQLRLLTQLPPEENWERQQTPPADGPVCTVAPNRSTGELIVSVLPALSVALLSGDNRGERELVLGILRGLRQLLPLRHQDLLSEERVAPALEQHAPLGQKKKFFTIDAASNPSLHPSPGLPDERPIQEADQELLLDDVGESLIRNGWPVGAVAPDHRDKLLQEAVEYLYGRFQSLVASLSSRGLLEWLIAHHEKITREWAFLRLTLPTRIACFDNEEEVLSELRTQLPAASHLRLASRFVIEYVAARPPSGIRPMSRSVYDELIALAAEIVNFGSLSDLCHFQIEDIRWSILESGRLGRDARRYIATRQQYLDSHSLGQVHRAREGFGGHWVKRDRQSDELQDRINAAMVAEVGVGFTDIMDVLGVAITMGLENGDAVSRCLAERFIQRVRDELRFTEEKVRKVLGLLTLEPRDDYLNPSGFRREATYPWRLDRPLSYVRRPFVVRKTDQGQDLLWGFRHADQVGRYLIDAWLYGRIKAQSQEMKKLVSQLHNERGKEFNDKVADALEEHPGLIVKRRVAKIGKVELPGDIDVLVAIPEKRRLRVIECKDLEPARMPHEIGAELLKIFKGRKKSAIEKHLGRLEWVQAHPEEVLEFLGCNDGGTWKAEALFVTDTELLTPFLEDSPVRFVPIAEIGRIL